MARIFRHREGSTLPLVLIFSSIAFITVAAFSWSQYLIGKPSLMAPAMLQARLNARSGVWKALDMLNHPPDTLKGTNTLDSTFTNGLLGDHKDTSALPPTKLVPDDSLPFALQPFSCDSFGSSEVMLSYAGCFEELRSKGIFLNKEKLILVRLGGRLSISSDTVLFLDSGQALQTPIRGKYKIGPRDSTAKIRGDDLKNLISHFANEIGDSVIDTMLKSPPLLVQHTDDFIKIPSVVKGPLFIDGSLFELSWKTDRKIVVLGDLQITGKVLVGGATFIVTGETKILDDAHFQDVTIFSAKRFIVQGKAVFSGCAITLANILVSGNAAIENKSMLVIAHGITANSSGKSDTAKNNRTNVNSTSTGHASINSAGNAGGVSTSVSNVNKTLNVFSATFTESAIIDATIIASNNPLGIKIDNSAMVKGVLWTDGAMSLDGKASGIIYASKLVDGAQAVSGVSTASISVIRGNVLPLQDFDRYFFPFFLGKLSIISWLEQS